MRRLATLTSTFLMVFAISACDILDPAADDEGVELDLSAAALQGKFLQFEDEVELQGENQVWEYTFAGGIAIGCNANNSSIESVGFSSSGNMIRIDFAQGFFEEYTLVSAEGSIQTNNLNGDFRLVSNIPGNEREGRFRQVTVPLYCDF